ncbi:DUF2279 domain-containing protein [Aestuariivivens sediminicola]|uniref:DUF2279 domain-containing protein n=1 Tax=Aestuariivivens sediminicola TaxID=2913560 RepID=UPI001F571359|nr:DUF2279 domain-containing protein [Aestuariivivens sediminicola]
MTKKLIYGLYLFVSLTYSQSKVNGFLKPSDTLNTSRVKSLVITEASLAAVSLIALDQLWYADYRRSKFHTVNDNNEWLQMDKMGHVFASYQIGRVGADLLNWSGVSKKDQLIYGATLGFGFLTAVEIFDGYSKEWGYSWGDVMANAAGTGLFVGQELLWKEQRILFKYSYHQTRYPSLNPDKLGHGLLEQMLKDYNGQSYWLSININDFFGETGLPEWLNFALGYSADGMLRGSGDIDSNLLTNTVRKRQILFSFDVNLNKIRTDSRFLRTVFSVLNVFKVPFPAFEISKKGSAFHLLYI